MAGRYWSREFTPNRSGRLTTPLQDRLQASLGAFTAQSMPAEPGLPPRRMLLWAVLGLGVAALAAATWTLWRQGPEKP